MNRFTSVNEIFTANGLEPYGEIVTLTISYLVKYDNVTKFIGDTSWKRKTAALPASVNAFHMHRGLCREFRGLKNPQNPVIEVLTTREIAQVKKLIGDAVFYAYAKCAGTNYQHFHAAIRLSFNADFSEVTVQLLYDVYGMQDRVYTV